MGLGIVILIVTLIGCIVAGLASGRGMTNALGSVAFGLLTSLIVAYLWAPIALIGDPYFLEGELRLAAIIIIPVGISAFIGARVRKTLSLKGNI